MATVNVVILDPSTSRPQAYVDVEARKQSDGTVIDLQTTNIHGVATFDITDDATFHARTANKPPLYQVGHPIGEPFMNVDYVVDPAGQGTHTTLTAAVAAAIAAGGDKTIWICSSPAAEDAIDLGGIGVSQNITIASHSRNTVVLTAKANDDIFTQSTVGGETNGGLHFRNVALSIPTADKAVYFVNTDAADHIVHLTFDECRFDMGVSGAFTGYLARQTGSPNIGLNNLGMRIVNCTGSAEGFFSNPTAAASQAPTVYFLALNNHLAMGAFWDGGANLAAPPETIVQGGHYTLDSGIAFPVGRNNQHFRNLYIVSNVAGPIFSFGSSVTSTENHTYANIAVEFTNTAGYFGNFGSHNVNPNDTLFFDNLFGWGSVDVSANTFLVVDTDWTNVHVGNIHAPDFGTLYSGPLTDMDALHFHDHGNLVGRSDDDHEQYLLLAGRTGGQYAAGRVDLAEAFLRLGMGGHYEFEVVIDGAAAYWRLGEASGNLIDIGGNGNAGTPNGSITYGVTGALNGDSDDAITLDGSTAYVSADDDDSLDLGDGPFTLEAWVKKAANGTSMTIVSKGSGAYQLRFSTTNKLTLLRENVAQIVSSTSTITDTNWHHVVATKNGAAVLLYIDGVDVTDTVSDSTMVDTTDAFHIGRRVTAADEWFDGSIDEVAIYPVVLTPAQVLAHFNAGDSGRGRLSRVSFDSGDHIEYDEANDFFSFIIGDAEQARLSASSFYLKEQADADGDVAAFGQFWVNTATPNEAYFTDDDGNDRELAYAGGAFHDGMSDFVANEHIDHTAVTLTAGVGLSGGGDISANRTFTVDLNELTTEVAIAAGDFIAMVDITDSGSGKITFANLEATISHDNIADVSSDDHHAQAHAADHADGGSDELAVQDLASDAATDGQIAKADGAGAVAFEDDEAGIEFMIDGGGSVISTGIAGWLAAPFACTIKAVRLFADQSGSIVVDIWKDTYANYPPTVADTITAAAKPTISGTVKDEDTTLTGWTTTVAKGDILYYNVDSVATIEKCLVVLEVDKT